MKTKFFRFVIVLLMLVWPVGASTSIAIAQSNCSDKYEPNDDGGRATQLQSGRFRATICPSNDVDIYKFSMSASETIYIQLTNLPADFDMSLYSSNKGDWVSESENGNTSDENIKWTTPNSDTLYLVVYGYDNASSSNAYTLNIYKGDVATNLNAIRQKMKQEDFNRFMELLKYVVDSQRCVSSVKSAWTSGVTSVTTSCAGAASEISKVINGYINPSGVYGDRGDIGSLDLNAYCSYKYGNGAYAVMGDRWDAYSWGCYKNSQYVGGLNMEEVCKMQYPDLPHVTYSRWDAYSWQCIP